MPGRLVDTPLREGAQAPVPYLTPGQRGDLIAGLARIGVAEIELGHIVADTAMGADALPDLLAVAAARAPGVRRAVWCRATEPDIRAAAALGPDVVSFALPVSDLHLRARLHRDRAWALARVPVLVEAARSGGIGCVSIGLEDATRADPVYLVDVVHAAAEAGADRVRLADTVGIADPATIIGLVETTRRHFPGDIGVHIHDDFGMATAGSVAALTAGADWADVSLLGLGERSGIAHTEQVAAWLAIRGGDPYDVAAAAELSRSLAEWVGRPVPAQAPVIGAEIFTVESGLHLAGLFADPHTYEPYAPDLVSTSRSWRFGRQAGRAAVAGLLGGPDGTSPVRDVTAATAAVRAAAEARGRSLAPDEVAEVLSRQTAGRCDM